MQCLSGVSFRWCPLASSANQELVAEERLPCQIATFPLPVGLRGWLTAQLMYTSHFNYLSNFSDLVIYAFMKRNVAFCSHSALK